MKRYLRFSFIIIATVTLNSCFETQEKFGTCDPCTSPTSYTGYSPIFTEEFNGSTLEESWNYVEGNGCPEACGFGSGELQIYQNSNISVRDGNLVITAKKETVGSNQYTSGRINTFNTTSLTYGRIDIRAKLPKGQGLWAGVWLLGDNIYEVGWPKAGHISLLEMRGGEQEGRNNTLIGKLIWGESSKPEVLSDFVSIENGIFNDKFHVFSIIWEPTRIQWLLNDRVYFEQKLDSSMNNTFNKPFHMILNVAVGGQFPGNPDSNTVFPQEMEVDYIRVFQK